jgi:hypothetical protein
MAAIVTKNVFIQAYFLYEDMHPRSTLLRFDY